MQRIGIVVVVVTLCAQAHAFTVSNLVTRDVFAAPARTVLRFKQRSAHDQYFRFTRGTAAHSLVGADTIQFVYGPASGAWTQVVAGVAFNLAQGSVRVPFTAANTDTNGTFQWELVIGSNTTPFVEAYGMLELLPRVGAGAGTFPTSTNVIDLSAWTYVNAPWNSLAGDVTGTLAATTVAALRGYAVGTNAPLAGEVLAWDGAAWGPSAAGSGDITGVTAGAGLAGGGESGAVTISNSAATTASLALADSALQRTGGTMTGALNMGTNVVSGQRFGAVSGVESLGDEWTALGVGAGSYSSGDGWLAAGSYAGDAAVGDYWLATGHYAGNAAVGDFWTASGLFAGRAAVHTNSAAFGQFAGRSARGNNRGYWDVYATDPAYADGGATNDTIFLDNDGKLYIGGGAARAENPSAGVVLRGPARATGDLNMGGNAISNAVLGADQLAGNIAQARMTNALASVTTAMLPAIDWAGFGGGGGGGAGLPANTNAAPSYLYHAGATTGGADAVWRRLADLDANRSAEYSYSTNFFGDNATGMTNDSQAAWSWTVPVGVYQVEAKLFGGGGGGGGLTATGTGGVNGGYGGLVAVTMFVRPGDVVSGYVGQGGWVTNATSTAGVYTRKAYPGGGTGMSSWANYSAGGGGAYTSISTGGVTVAIAAGGGGSGANASAAGGAGGSTTGQAGVGTLPGGGGTQSAGGAATAPSTAGASLQGGNSVQAGSNQSLMGGGGGGYFGGGGGYGGSSQYGTGGGGSNYRSPAVIGYSQRGGALTTDADPDFLAGYGTGGLGAGAGNAGKRGAPGRVLIKYNVEM